VSWRRLLETARAEHERVLEMAEDSAASTRRAG
jgi:hypothetical protein